MDSQPANKRMKSTHWSEDEKLDLVRLVGEQRTPLFAKFNSSITRKKREQAWAGITYILNCRHRVRRGVKECKKQWQNLKQQLKTALQWARQHDRQSGAGRNEHEIPAQLEAVRDVLGPQNPVLVGLSGGIDLSEGTTGDQQVLSCDAAVPGPSGQQTANTGTDSTEYYTNYDLCS
ncbi:hypothetical protein V5799_019460 [Amblyomma americanum]|uniref:Regulatory protein zeste n=1 Tax=Amblyomma americanum TaxID=6943 RepID=A0AAQ4EXB3_AMBAM